MKLIIKNKTLNLTYMNTPFKRLKGLMFKKNIKQNLIFKTNSIHTIFCLENIDVIMIDKQKNIKYIYPNLKPYRIILPKKQVHYTIEMPQSTIKQLKINKNTKLKIEE